MNVFTSKVDKKDNTFSLTVDLNQDRIDSNPSVDKNTKQKLIKSERIMSLGSPQVIGITDDGLVIKAGINIFAMKSTPIEVA